MDRGEWEYDSRVVVGPTIEKFVAPVRGSKFGPAMIPNLRDALVKRIRVIQPVTQELATQERKLRYQRTSEDILKEKWIFSTRVGNDMVTVVQGILKALKVESRYVAVHEPFTLLERVQRWRRKQVSRIISFHAICEARFPEGTFLIDVMAEQPVTKGCFVKDQSVLFGKTAWVMFSCGRDSWEIGLRTTGSSIFVYGAVAGVLLDD